MSEIIVGIDEVGRGPWAGPVVACAVAWPADTKSKGVKDSKKLSRRQRELLIDQIRHQAVSVGIGWVMPGEIDRHGLTAAIRQAMLDALDMINCAYREVIVDGAYNFLASDCKLAQAVTRADQTHSVVMAASIVAKVSRDRYMYQMARLYPSYQFDQHVGYGTKLHRELLTQNGPSPIHRLSFQPLAGLS